MAERLDDLKEVEVPLGEVRVFLRPKEGERLSIDTVGKILLNIEECLQEVRGATNPSIIYLPQFLDVIVVHTDGKVEVY